MDVGWSYTGCRFDECERGILAANAVMDRLVLKLFRISLVEVFLEPSEMEVAVACAHKSMKFSSSE